MDGFALVRVESLFDASTRIETALIDDEGRILWTRLDQSWYPSAYLGENGLVALSGGGEDGFGLLVRPDGTTEPYGRAWPIAAPRADGVVGARAPSDGPNTIGWATPNFGFSPLDSPFADQDDARTAVSYQADLVYLAWTDLAQRVVVRATPDDATVIPLAISNDAAYLCALDMPNEAGWAMVDDLSLPLAAVDLDGATANVLDVTFPPDLRPFDAGPTVESRIIEEDGSILIALRDDAVGAVYRSHDGVGWTRVGRTVSDVANLEAAARAGTVAILATSVRDSVETWPAESTADLPGDSLQIVREADGIVETLPAPPEVWDGRTVRQSIISHDGDCVVYGDLDGRDQTVHVLRVSTGERIEVGVSTGVDARIHAAWLTSANP
jgi:hypothetical protein